MVTEVKALKLLWVYPDKDQFEFGSSLFNVIIIYVII